jgi:hypothetical protein
LLDTSGSQWQSELFARLKSGGLWLEARLSKEFTGPHVSRKKLGMVVCVCHPSYGGKLKIKLWSRLAWAKSETLSLK